MALCLMHPFRFHSPPFLTPWAAVTSFTEKQLFATHNVTFSFSGSTRQVTFAGSLGQTVKARYQASSGVAAGS